MDAVPARQADARRGHAYVAPGQQREVAGAGAQHAERGRAKAILVLAGDDGFRLSAADAIAGVGAEFLQRHA
ncbi:hypothetical protein G6F40_017929 [Rhizopus arrhizus]|nr:hypothetical protein G6F40_017929 [Rhizopus arrhizus]